MKTVNLDALDRPRFVERDGKKYQVRGITPRVASLLDAAANEEGNIAKMVAYYDAVAALIPSMPREEVDNLSPDHIQAILELAGEQIETVEEAARDGAPPKAEGTASPASAPATT